jgi:hypothetical protein
MIDKLIVKAVFVNLALFCTGNAQLVYITNVDLLFLCTGAESAGFTNTANNLYS